MERIFEDREPPSLPSSAVRVFTAGGLGEIGRNMSVIQYGAESLVIDCGVLFPSRHTPGIDLILPDLEMLDRAGCDPKWLILTHGHEDHIGALPYLLRRKPKLNVIGSRLTLALARGRLSEHGIDAQMQQVTNGDIVDLGPFRVALVSVAHSVPDSLACHVSVGGKRIVHTGDFKIDDTTLDGRITDLSSFAKFGEAGVDLLLSDSTNADVKGDLRGEGSISEPLQEIFDETQGRVIFACFASNVHRVQQAVNCAFSTSRRVAFTGRSMVRNMTIAQELGYLSVPAKTEISFEDCQRLAAREQVIICTGSQGEPLSALARMARGEHSVKVSESDTVILSARFIPGNEADIFGVVNSLSKKGVRVLTPENAPVHASGHAGEVDLARMINATRPKFLIPVHGEWRHLRAHSAVAVAAGLDEQQVLLVRNGDSVDLVEDVALVSGSFGFSEIYVDGTSVGHVGKRVLRDRVVMSEGGLAQIVVVVDTLSQKQVARPVVDLRGISDSGSLRMDLHQTIDEAVASWTDAGSSAQVLRDAIRREVSTSLKRRYGIQPLISVQVVDLGTEETV